MVPLLAPSSHGQAKGLPRDVVDPILVVNGLGHTAPLRALAFTPDGNYLLSGGMDKVVHVWEFRGGRPRLDRTIRPPIRNVSGAVYALAASTADDRRLIAVAGYSLLDGAGQILFYRLPPLNDPGPAELAFELPDRVKNPGTDARGHAGVVNGLSITRDGHYLASCGEDGTIRIWDLQDDKHLPVRVLERDPTGLRGHAGAVTGVAFVDGGGNRLVSTGGMFDGSVRLWDRGRADPLIRSVKPTDEDRTYLGGRAFAINALAAIPDGPYVAIGRENGHLECYDADLGNGHALNPEEWVQKLNLAVEALALASDGRTLAAIVFMHTPTPGRLPRTECKVILKALPGGEDRGVVRTTGDVARALAFSPDRRFLAMGGGAAQEVAVKPWADPAAPVVELRGPGTVLWDVAFVDVASKPTVAYARSRPLAGAQPAWEAFDFPARQFVPVDPAARLERAITTYDGRTVATPALDRLTVSRAQGDPVTITLDVEAGRWTSYTFIPANPGAGHASPALAVGGSTGLVSIYTLEGRRTRAFQGHSGPVYGMAPSSDGRWLATASADQTVRLWSLAGCDTRPALGAALRRDPQGRWIVDRVATRSPAQEMGLRAGDRVEGARKVTVRIQGGLRITTPPSPLAIERLDDEIEAIEPGSFAIEVQVDRPGGPAPNNPLSTFRRDRPALSLLPGLDSEWIVWMPESYYDTSIAGDSRLLGWHVNKIVVDGLGAFIPRASEFHPMADYAERLHRPGVIEDVIRTADPAGVLAAVGVGVPAVRQPLRIRLARPGPAAQPLGTQLTVQEPALTLQIEVEAAEGGQVRSIAVYDSPVPYPPDVFPQAAGRTRSINKELTLWRRDNPLIIEAADELGVKGRAELLVRVERPPVAPSKPRLVRKAIGVPTFAGADPIKYADRDVDAVTAFLAKPAEVPRFELERIDPPDILDGGGRNPRADTTRIRKIIDELIDEAKQERLGRGDTVFLVINSHVKRLDKDGPMLVLGSDARRDRPDQGGVRTGEITEALRYLTDRGCFVVLFLDGIHSKLKPRELNDFRTWVRELTYQARVVVSVASKQDPSDQLESQGIGVFAEAILESVNVQAGGHRDPSVEEFRNIVRNRVEELKKNTSYQKADLYWPLNLDERRTRLFDPQPRPAEELAAGVSGIPAPPR
jgi:WD40 repeat protein